MSVEHNNDRLKILLMASEIAPLAKTGGLADVANSLPKALLDMGHDVRLVMPCYASINSEWVGKRLGTFMVYLGGMGSLSGSVLSAVMFTVLIEALRFVIPEMNALAHHLHLIPENYEIGQVWKWVIIPMILILTMQFRPEGLMGSKELSDFFPFLKKFYRMRQAD